MVVRKAPSLFSVSSSSSSTKSSHYPPSVFSKDCEGDDDDTMSTSTSADDQIPSKPLSVAIPTSNPVHGPYCPRRPNLREILANTSEAPWTLAAFMAYLSNNHCLETLEFTMDAGRYKKHYAKMMSRAGNNTTPPAKDREYVQALWQRLVDAYIRPSGSREVNLPSNVRDPIINLAPGELPPPPETLDRAVTKIYELMDESVLVPFLNSVYPQTAHSNVTSCPMHASHENLPSSTPYHDDRSNYYRRNRHGRNSPPPQTAVEPHAHSYSPPSAFNRKSAPSPITTPLNKIRTGARLSHTTSSPSTAGPTISMDAVASAGSGPGMTDDSASGDSPAGESPTTPPITPPGGDGHSPKRDSGMWKKLGRLSGMKTVKKKSQGGLREEQRQ